MLLTLSVYYIISSISDCSSEEFPAKKGSDFEIFPVPSTATTNAKGSFSFSAMTLTSLSTLLSVCRTDSGKPPALDVFCGEKD